MTAKIDRHGSAEITLPSDTEYLITRVFDAPAEAVFRAYTTPDLVKRWWGFETSEWQVCDIDLRVGGAWRYVIREGDVEVGFHGEYREIERPAPVVHTEAYEGIPDPDDHAAVNIVTLEESDGVTTMKVLVQHNSKEDRDTRAGHGHGAGHAAVLRPDGGPDPGRCLGHTMPRPHGAGPAVDGSRRHPPLGTGLARRPQRDDVTIGPSRAPGSTRRWSHDADRGGCGRLRARRGGVALGSARGRAPGR